MRRQELASYRVVASIARIISDAGRLSARASLMMTPNVGDFTPRSSWLM